MKKQEVGNKMKTPDWLKTIQLNSWEAELLISALVLYTLFQVPGYINEFQLTSFERDSLFHGFFRILKRAVELLSLGYITHILVRGIWVANIGLSYVFPNGVNKERLSFKGKFAKEIDKHGSIVKDVLRLEELSSMVYGISFLLFGLLLGFGTLFLPFIALSQSLGTLVEQKSSYAVFAGFGIIIYLVIFLILFIDFVTNGLFRRIDWTAKIYYPVALLFRVLTLSFLYRRALLVLVSNVKGWKSYMIPIVLFIVTFSFTLIKKEISLGERKRYLQNNHAAAIVPSNYESKRNSGEFFIASIQDDLISESVLKVFFSDLSILSKLHSRNINVGTKWSSLNSSESAKLLNEWINFSIDSSNFIQPEWFVSQHPKELYYGFSTFVDIKELERGHHSLKVTFDTTQMDRTQKKLIRESEYENLTLSNIQFFYSIEE